MISGEKSLPIYVDYAGQPCDINEIKQIAEEFNLYLIEDASHALGASYHGKKIGNFADLTVFSFHPVKPITTGEGGAVVTNNAELANKIRLLHNHGIDKSATDRYGPNAGWAYDMKVLGRNYRMTDIQAALGISQLQKLDSFIERRNEIASLYDELLKKCDFVETPITTEKVVHGWHIFTVLLDESVDRNEVFKHMRKNDIGVNVHYIPAYHFSYYQNHFNFNKSDFPETENVFNRIITLPIHPGMKDKDVEQVVKTLKCGTKL
jgi:dTDP-4-amino-4,6-dideoxygalactose transaminase